MADQHPAVSRRPLVMGVVAGCVLCGVWLLPSPPSGDEAQHPASDAELSQQDEIRPVSTIEGTR
ncbi:MULTISPECIES: hypothetical protein [Streptomyces]|uniref:Uncharacterized protein n=2 Tax=Streptomyces TaxID=1883 RepID=A0ABX1CFE3_9ACTN|nr:MULTISPECIES: hypothetical protein [Streptomyces]NJP66922.1 hypothetical protein [Streptomyces spiramenti]NJQ16555.1 hypothetical protein [Streptomyces bohaiensis]